MVPRSARWVRWLAAPQVELFVDEVAEAGEFVPVGLTDAVAADVRPFGEDPPILREIRIFWPRVAAAAFWISARCTSVGSAVTAALSSAGA